MAELKGVFYYGQTKNGHFNFHLKAPNRETIGVCEGAYADLSSCKKGIASVQKFAPVVVEKIEDLTLVKPMEPLKFPKAEVYKDKQGKFRFRIYANNGNLVCISESGYAVRGADTLWTVFEYTKNINKPTIKTMMPARKQNAAKPILLSSAVIRNVPSTSRNIPVNIIFTQLRSIIGSLDGV